MDREEKKTLNRNNLLKFAYNRLTKYEAMRLFEATLQEMLDCLETEEKKGFFLKQSHTRKDKPAITRETLLPFADKPEWETVSHFQVRREELKQRARNLGVKLQWDDSDSPKKVKKKKKRKEKVASSVSSSSEPSFEPPKKNSKKKRKKKEESSSSSESEAEPPKKKKGKKKRKKKEAESSSSSESESSSSSESESSSSESESSSSESEAIKKKKGKKKRKKKEESSSSSKSESSSSESEVAKKKGKKKRKKKEESSSSESESSSSKSEASKKKKSRNGKEKETSNELRFEVEYLDIENPIIFFITLSKENWRYENLLLKASENTGMAIGGFSLFYKRRDGALRVLKDRVSMEACVNMALERAGEEVTLMLVKSVKK